MKSFSPHYLIAASLAGAAVFVVYYTKAFVTPPHPEPRVLKVETTTNSPPAHLDTQAPPAQLAQELSRLRQELSKLRGDVRRLENSAETRVSATAGEENPGQNDFIVVSEDPAQKKEQDKREDELIAKQLETNLRSEPIDQNGSTEATSLLLESVNRLGSSVYVGDVECRTSMCRVEIADEEKSLLQDGIQALTMQPPLDSGGFVQYVELPGEAPKAVIYFSRPGFALSPNE